MYCVKTVSKLCHFKIKRATNVDLTTFIAQCMETAGVDFVCQQRFTEVI